MLDVALDGLDLHHVLKRVHAEDFLFDHFQVFDAQQSTGFYPKLRFLLGDYSPATLDTALAAVGPHAPACSVIPIDATNPFKTLSFLRFKMMFVHLTNVYDNLTFDEIARRDGELYIIEVRPYLSNAAASALMTDFSLTPDALKDAIRRLLDYGPVSVGSHERGMIEAGLLELDPGFVPGLWVQATVLSHLAPLLEHPNPPSCAMLIIDIDHFKSINDQHGHPEGDEALILVAAKLREQVCEPAFIGRLGGEEFVVVMPGADYDKAYRMAERFRETVMAIDTRRWLQDRRITVSVGLTMSRESGDTPSTMLQRADAALYEAKRAGRNCVKANLPAPAEVSSTAPVRPVTVEYA